jgi:NIPSNAP
VEKLIAQVNGLLRSAAGRRSLFLMACVLSFMGGSLFPMGWTNLHEVHANENRVFELMIYHTVSGKVPALESIFRDVSRQQAQYNLKVLGYWVPDEDPAWKDTFVYVVEHPSREAAEANWRALHSDPAFLPYRRAAEPLIEKVNGSYHVDEVYMRPSEFSPLK